MAIPPTRTNAPEDADDSSGRLASGAIAGISVGVSLGALAVLGTVVFFIRRRHHSRAHRAVAEVEANPAPWPAAQGSPQYNY